MLEDFLCSFAFIICTVSALSDLLENSIFELLKTIDCNVGMAGLLCTDSPSLENKLYKVVILLSRKSSINIRVVLNESILSNEAVLLALSHSVYELSADNLRFLFSCLNSGVIISTVSCL
jgi:hypothetical protein